MDWEYLLEDGKAAKKYMGTVLSGEKLLDDKNYRDKLHKTDSQSEMADSIAIF